MTVEYEPFAQKVKGFVENMMTVDVMRRKAQLIQLGSFKPEKEIEKYEINELELFKVSIHLQANFFVGLPRL